MKLLARTQTLIVVLAGFASILGGGGAAADVGAYEYINPGPSIGNAYVVPSGSNWVELSSITFLQSASSDWILSGTVFLTEQNVPDGRLEFSFLLDDTQRGWYVARTPEDFPSSLRFSAAVGDVPWGIHTVGIRMRNLTAAPVYFNRDWISLLLVEGSNFNASSILPSSTTVGTAWTTLISRTVTSSTSQMAYLRAYVGVSSGSASARVEMRLRRGTSQIAVFESGTLDALPDGAHLSAIDRAANDGQNTYTLEARVISGASVTVNAADMTVQHMPRYTVFEAKTFSASVPNNGTWRTIATTPWMPVDSVSLSPLPPPAPPEAGASDGFGFAFLRFEPTTNTEVSTSLCLDYLDEPKIWEIGWVGAAPKLTTEYFGWASDWEKLRMYTDHRYRLRLRARGDCTNSGSVEIADGVAQVIAVPNGKGFACFLCEGADINCTCTPPNLSTTTISPTRDCFPSSSPCPAGDQ